MTKSDLYNQYHQYTTNDLLKIIREASDYRPEAIGIAKEILLQRGVTDIDEATAILTTIETIQRKASSQKETTVKPVTSLPDWGYILFTVVVLISIYTFYITAVSVNESLAKSYDDKKVTLSMILQLAMVPVLFILLFKRNRWGWILATGLFLFKLVAVLLPFIIAHRDYREYNLVDKAIIFALLYLLICIGLTRQSIRNSFVVYAKHVNYAVATAVLFLAVLMFELMKN